MDIKLISFLVFLFYVQFSFGQTEDDDYGEDDIESFTGLKKERKKLDLHRFRAGGDFGLGFSNGAVFAEFSPTIGYQIIEHRLEVGPGLVYQHESLRGIYSINNVGGQAYVRAYVWQGFFVQVDGFLVNFNFDDVLAGRQSKFTYGNGFVGAGYAINHKSAPFYLTFSAKTTIVLDQFYPNRRIIPNIGFQIRL